MLPSFELSDSQEAPSIEKETTEERSVSPPADERSAYGFGVGAEDLKRVMQGILGVARKHWLFLLLFGAGTALRGVAFFAYQPALLNSVEYLSLSEDLRPGTVHPVGYPTLLWLLPLDGGLTLVPLVQHLLGLAIAVLIYAVLLRLGVGRWLAALAAAPVLLDAYQLNIEEYVSPEVLFELLLVVGCVLLLWQRNLSATFAGLAGATLAAAALTRPIGVLVIVPALLTVSFRRPQFRSALALLALFVIPLAGYAAWVDSVHGVYGLTSSTGRHLYGRVAAFADCSELSLPAQERVLCPKQPVGERPPVDELVWGSSSPIAQVDAPDRDTKAGVAEDFARRVIRHQPLDYLRAVGSDVLRGFAPTRGLAPGEFGAPPWQFHLTYPIFFKSSVCSPKSIREAERELKRVDPGLVSSRATDCVARTRRMYRTIRGYGDGPSVDRSLAVLLRRYQHVGYAPGPLLAAGLLVGFAAALGLGRARRSGLRSAAFLFSGAAVAVCLGSNLAAVFAWRYQLPQLVLIPPALAVGLTALTTRR